MAKKKTSKAPPPQFGYMFDVYGELQGITVEGRVTVHILDGFPKTVRNAEAVVRQALGGSWSKKTLSIYLRFSR